MKKAAIYPFNKISQGLINYTDLIRNFKIESIIDFAYYINEDSGSVINNRESSIIVSENIEESLMNADVLLLNDGVVPFPPSKDNVERYNKNRVIEKWKDMILKAKEKNIKIIAVAGIDDEEILKWIRENEIKVFTPKKSIESIEKKIQGYLNVELKNRAKRIAIFGTQACIGKFTAQMNLFREIKKAGKLASCLITEPTSFIFGQEQVSNLDLDYFKLYEYYTSVLNEIDSLDYEYVIMADQGGITDFKNRPLDYICNKMALLKAFVPDKVLLVANYNDLESIKNSLTMIKVYTGISKIDAILLPDRIEIDYGKYIVKSKEEFMEMKGLIEKAFDIKVGQAKELKNIMEYIC